MSSWNVHLTQLNKILASLYTQKDQSFRIVAMAGLQSGNIAFKDAALDNWYNILNEANKRGQVDLIVQIASSEYPENEDLKSLYKEVNAEPLLQTASSYKVDNLKFLIAEGKTKETIKTLLDIGESISSDFYTTVIMQSARFKSLENDKLNGVIYPQDYAVGIAKINHALLSLLDDVPNELKIKAMINSQTSEISSKKVDLLIPEKSEFEKVIGKEELFEISWLSKALKASKSVCKVQLSNGSAGTGFLLKGGYLVTNNHVIPSSDIALTSKIIFNYRLDEKDNVQDRAEYRLDTNAFITASEDTLDYTVVKVKDNTDIPLSEWGVLELDDFSDPKIGDKVNIIQHPEGNYMKMALPDEVVSLWDNYIFYIADTKGGSSGSPVFSQDWKVIALHHAGKSEQSAEGGMQINANGDIKPSNRGILIKHIIKDLKTKGLTF